MMTRASNLERRGPSVLRAATISIAALLLTTSAARATGLLVPNYAYPEPGNTFWPAVEQAAGLVPVIVILNPDSGPGSAVDSAHVDVVNAVRSAGARVIGYVDTEYGARSLAAVLGEIDLYHGFYEVDGIFVDQMSNVDSPALLDYYAAVYDHAKTFGGNQIVVGNPGTTTEESYLTRPTADILVTYDNFGDYPSYEPSSWVSNHPAAAFCHLVSEVANPDTMVAYVALANARHAGWVFITDDTAPNPWDDLPTYWDAEVAEITTKQPCITITAPPNSISVNLGASASFQVSASGPTPLTYQWRKNGIPVPGANGTTYFIPVVTLGDSGSYDVVISTGCGVDTSETAVLTVIPRCIPPSDLIAWWRGDDNANDYADGHHGAFRMVGGGTEYFAGLVGSAFRFIEGNDQVEVPDAPAWDLAGDFTIQLWVNFAETPVQYQTGTLANPGNVFLGHDEGPGNQNKWVFALGGDKLHFHINSPGTGPVYLAQADFPMPTFNTRWYHLAVTRSGNLYTIYVDGIPSGSEVSAIPVPNANALLMIGQAEGFFFDYGRMDEIAIHSRALSAAELRAIYDAGSLGMCRQCIQTAGNALVFDGSNYVEIPHDASLSFPDYSSMTIEFWLKLASGAGVFHVLGKRDACTSGPLTNYQVGRDESLGIHAGRGDCTAQTGIAPLENLWVHYAFTFSSTECRAYYNSNLVHQRSSPGSPTNPNSATLRIGTSGVAVPGGCLGVQGTIDEVRIWNVVRTPEEIGQSYRGRVNPNTPGLVGYWNFDEALGDPNAYDLSPFGNDGMLWGSSPPVRVASSAPVDTCRVLDVPRQAPRSSRGHVLGTPFPNPTRGTVEFSVTLAASKRVRIGVYDVAGSLVARLTDAELGPGVHWFEWSGTGSRGRRVKPGIYFLNLEANDVREGRTLIMVR